MNLELLDQCRRFRGHIPDDWLARFEKDDRDLALRARMYKLASRAAGKQMPYRDWLYRPTFEGNHGLTHYRQNNQTVIRFYGKIGKDVGEISSDKFSETLFSI